MRGVATCALNKWSASSGRRGGPSRVSPAATRPDCHFPPKDGSAAEAVEQMARTWWDKAPPDAELGDGQPAADRRARRAAGKLAPLPGLWRAPAAWVVAASTGGRAGPAARVSYRCARED